MSQLSVDFNAEISASRVGLYKQYADTLRRSLDVFKKSAYLFEEEASVDLSNILPEKFLSEEKLEIASRFNAERQFIKSSLGNQRDRNKVYLEGTTRDDLYSEFSALDTKFGYLWNDLKIRPNWASIVGKRNPSIALPSFNIHGVVHSKSEMEQLVNSAEKVYEMVDSIVTKDNDAPAPRPYFRIASYKRNILANPKIQYHAESSRWSFVEQKRYDLPRNTFDLAEMILLEG